ncbi:hypothetical protein [Uliginosibacterium gangwonense]|uniref:hypothetical protein n=1 Tax=Uliginosibacterium gangwonense TaxID=392736 RepID=UPI00037A7E25|nr:hypothetical protein [Uliginosibacterium gangwonense]
MKTNEAYDLTTPDRVYGEIYEANGMYWAEVIMMEDGLDYVVEQSADFANRAHAKAWLLDRKLAVAPTFEEVMAEVFAKLAVAAKRVRGAFGFGGRIPSAA